MRCCVGRVEGYMDVGVCVAVCIRAWVWMVCIVGTALGGPEAAGGTVQGKPRPAASGGGVLEELLCKRRSRARCMESGGTYVSPVERRTPARKAETGVDQPRSYRSVEC